MLIFGYIQMLGRLRIFLTGFYMIFCFSLIKAQDGHIIPIANYEVSNLCYGSVASFSNTSTSLSNHAFSWVIWQMGISAPIYTSSATNINFQFPVKTTYTVQLNVTNYTSVDSHSDDATRTIVIDSVPVSNFSFQRCHSKFSNLSCCTNTYLWDFGDGSPISTLVNPSHTYSASAFYTVTLIASNGVISDTTTGIAFPVLNILDADYNIVYDADTVRFNSVNDSAYSHLCDWEWDFGDGTTLDIFGIDGWKVKHHYQPYERDSIYHVTLHLRDLCNEDEAEKTVLIKGIGKNVTGTSVFPSPIVHGYLNIESNEKDKLQDIKIIDCLGKRLDGLVPSEKPYGYYFWIDNLATGVYFVQLVFTDRVENHKIIKE